MGIRDLWSNYTTFRFGLSPHGNGLDTHRTWELLFFGVVPIVKTSSLDILYKDMPIIIVQEYSDLCQENYLPNAWNKIQHLWPVSDKVFTTDYWLFERYQQIGGDAI